jgi:hypothetical protein
VAGAAESKNISRQTACKWWWRYQDCGPDGLVDRSSRPRRCPTKPSDKVERRVVELRRRHQLGPARLAPRAGLPASTVQRILQRHGVGRLSDLDRKNGRVIRRIETSRPGELVHMDIKKQAKIPPAAAGESTGRRTRTTTAAQAVLGRVMPTSIRWSTPTAGWPTQRSTPMSRRSP